MILNNQTLKAFQAEIADKNSKLGGGAVSIMTASFSASLIEMVCNLTLEEKGYEKVQNYISKINKDVLELKRKLNRLAEEDKLTSSRISKAKKTGDNSVVSKTVKNAIEVSMEIRRISQNLEKIGFRVSKIGHKSSISDSRTAIYLARAASKSALESVKMKKRLLVDLLDKSKIKKDLIIKK